MSLLDNDTQISVLVDGLDHAEGLAWGLDGFAYAGGESGQLYRIDIARRNVAQFAMVGGGFMLGLALEAAHNIYVCDVGNHCVQRVSPGGVVATYSTGAVDEPLKTPNYPAFDSHGNLYVSDSGDWKADNGYIYKISPGGHGEVWSRAAREFPNGLCLGPDEDYLYVVMSVNPPRVDRFQVHADGSAGARETYVELPETVPDGVAFDSDGNLYISCYRPDRIYRMSPEGALEVLGVCPRIRSWRRKPPRNNLLTVIWTLSWSN